jgi:hypothetical protein
MQEYIFLGRLYILVMVVDIFVLIVVDTRKKVLNFILRFFLFFFFVTLVLVFPLFYDRLSSFRGPRTMNVVFSPS